MRNLWQSIARHRRIVTGSVVLLVIALGFVAAFRLRHEIRYDQVRAALEALTARQIALSLGFTAASYLTLTFYDVLALRMIGRPQPWRTAALASFSSYTLSHNLGLALLTGGSARYRIYAGAGLNVQDVARVIAIAAAMFWSGVLTICGLAMVIHQGPLQMASVTLPEAAARTIGIVVLLTTLVAVSAAGRRRPSLVIGGLALPVPSRGELLAQISVACVDMTCAAAALFVLLPAADLAQLPAFVLAYGLGLVAALISHVPGGIGVFESVVLAVVPTDRATLFAALIAYRIIYYLLPLALGLFMLMWHESVRHRHAGKVIGGVQTMASNLSPLVLSSAAFSGGAMLLLSGSLPAIHARMGVLSAILPLPFIEASHVGASVTGTALLLLAPGLYRRLDGACLATRVLLVAGALFSLAKGIDYEEAIVCLALAALLHVTRRAFYRRTALIEQPLTSGWLTAIAMAASLAAWAGLFAYRHVPYSDDLWWNFALHGDAPRFIRATLASAVVLTGFTIWRLLAPMPTHAPDRMGVEEWHMVRRIITTTDRAETMLALTGDKRFLLSEAADAFVMYQIKGSSWIVMGDPVGAQRSWASLLWKLRELSHRQQGRLLLYEVSSETLELAIGMGLQIVKFGEAAAVDLNTFDLEAPGLRSVRKSQRVAARAGARLRIVPAAAVPVILDELRSVSNEWMAAKGHQEKGFSLGRFDCDYLSNFDMALVMVEDRIVAFANLWLTANKNEASVDLMRQRNDAPAGSMDFLFANLLLWAKERGYRRFTLGMVPLSGIMGGHLAPTWAKAAALIFRHGETFYGFRGLRGYKDKFAPMWEPRYLAGPQGVGLIQALHDVSRLIGRGQPGATPPPELEVPITARLGVCKAQPV